MRTIAIEEHFIAEALSALMPGRLASRTLPPLLTDLGEARLADMDASGIDMQVLSVLAAEDVTAITPALARATNEELAGIVAAHPDRYAGFAILPLVDPAAAADELDHAVRVLGLCGAMVDGTVNGQFLDEPAFSPMLERAAELDVPIYLHPGRPPEVIRETYYGGDTLDAATRFQLATSAFGWHVETALHALRLMASGVFERIPQLTVILGHMGETLPFMIARAESKLGRPLVECFAQHFYITTSGFFSLPPLQMALQTVGADRIIFAVDHPISSNSDAREFFDSVPLAPADREKISYRNAEQLLGLNR